MLVGRGSAMRGGFLEDSLASSLGGAKSAATSGKRGLGASGSATVAPVTSENDGRRGPRSGFAGGASSRGGNVDDRCTPMGALRRRARRALLSSAPSASVFRSSSDSTRSTAASAAATSAGPRRGSAAASYQASQRFARLQSVHATRARSFADLCVARHRCSPDRNNFPFNRRASSSSRGMAASSAPTAPCASSFARARSPSASHVAADDAARAAAATSPPSAAVRLKAAMASSAR
mmetsp:Transcript_2662/g.8972  ORF Transcript_2662/g.8972 Transcript_2662/m.8972 type:complete len:236 (-) Transcript_2662:145-852(-)